jgi:glycosyltransferase involved in cell wall biosynthesis
MNVLWLTSWYPSKVSMLSGDFIERHAQASALMNHTYVIHVVKDTTGEIKKVTREEKIYSEKLTAVIYYYPSCGSLMSNIYFLRLHKRAFNEYKKKYGRPAGILVQVGIKAGIVALFRKKLSDIPYVLFERWTGFLETAQPNFKQQPALLRSLWRSVLRNARELVTASKFFGEYFKEHYGAGSYTVIPNYINEALFYHKPKTPGSPFRFIHISTLDYQKDFDRLLEAFYVLNTMDTANLLIVYGPILEDLQKKARKFGVEDKVIFKGEVMHEQIATALQEADVLVLCSRYETFGNVVMEANACGVPVMVSDLPVFHEIVSDGENGMIVPGDNVALLAVAMKSIKKNIDRFDSEKIAATANERYSKIKVAAIFDDLYKKHFS